MLPCSLSCSILQLPTQLRVSQTQLLPTFSRTCTHNSTHFTCFLTYCPSVSPTLPCTHQPFTTSAAHTSPSNSMPNPLARLAPCQTSGLLPEVTFLYKAFYPSRLKNFALGPPLKAIFFSCVMNSPQCVIIFSSFCLLCLSRLWSQICVVHPKTWLLARVSAPKRMHSLFLH